MTTTTTDPEATTTGSRLQWVAVLLIAAFVGVTYGFGIYVFSQLLPTMRRDLGFDYATAGRITAIGQLMFIVFASVATWLCTRVNGAVVIIGSGAVCAACLLGVAGTSEPLVLTVCLGVAAGTSASVYVPIVDIVPRLVPDGRRGTALGIISSGTTYGVFLSAAVIPAVTSTLGWRWVWVVVAALSIALIAAATLVFRRLGLFAAAPRRSEPGSGRTLRPATLLSFVAAWMVGIWIIKFMNGFSFMSFQNFLAPLLNDLGGRSIGYSSAVWLTIAVVGAVSGFGIGALADRFGIRRALTGCYVAFMVSCVLLHQAQGGWLPFVAAILFASAFYPIYGLVPAYVSAVATGVQATMVFGLANAFQGAGGIVGNLLGGRVASDTASLPGFYLILGAGALVMALGTTLLPSDRRTRDDVDGSS